METLKTITAKLVCVQLRSAHIFAYIEPDLAKIWELLGLPPGDCEVDVEIKISRPIK